MKTCTTHHICDCMQEKMSELERRLKQACESLRGAGTLAELSVFSIIADELEVPLEEK